MHALDLQSFLLFCLTIGIVLSLHYSINLWTSELRYSAWILHDWKSVCVIKLSPRHLFPTGWAVTTDKRLVCSASLWIHSPKPNFKTEAISPPMQNQKISEITVYSCCMIKCSFQGGVSCCILSYNCNTCNCALTSICFHFNTHIKQLYIST